MEEIKTSIFLRFLVLHFMTYYFFVNLFYTLGDPSTVVKESYINTIFANDVNYTFINKSKPGDTKFINTKLNAKNILEIPITNATVNGLTNYYRKYVEPYLKNGKYSGPLKGIKGHEFYSVSPPSWNSDIQWLSVNSPSSYEHLLPYFDEMKLTEIFQHIIDVDSKIVIYSIFYVVRSKILNRNIHVDFQNGTNVNGFTLLTPLQDNGDVHLFYKDINNKKRRYRYKKGIGVVFGENFFHSTDLRLEGGNREVVFCFSFGTDKLSDWEIIKNTAASQGEYYMHPTKGFTKNRNERYE